VRLDDYLKLLDWTGRQVCAGKRGGIPGELAPILERLRIRQEAWVKTVERFDRFFGHIVGRVEEIAEKARRIGRRWLAGTRAAAEAFP
jgi:hypothetical protein